MIEQFMIFLAGLNLFLIIILLALNWSDIRDQLGRVKKATWLLLIIILLFGTSLRVAAPHHHMMFIDEYWTMEAARNIVLDSSPDVCEYTDYEQISCSPYRKMLGTPLLFSLSFLLFGIGSHSAILISLFLGTLSILLIFMLTQLLLRREDISLLSSLILAAYPLYILWSGSASTNIPGIFFFLLSLTSFMLYLRTRTDRAYMLSLLSLVYAMQVRIELASMIAIFLLMHLIYSKGLMEGLKRSRLWDIRIAALILFISLIVQRTVIFLSSALLIYLLSNRETRRKLKNPRLWALWSVFLLFFISLVIQATRYNNLIFGEAAKVYSTLDIYQLFLKGLSGYASGILNGLYISYPIIILSLMGIVFLKDLNKRAVVVSATIFLIFSYLFAYYGKEKLLLFGYIGIIILSSSGAAYIKGYLTPRLGKAAASALVAVLLLAIFFPFVPPYYSTPITEGYTLDAKVLETQILEESASIPDGCYLVAPYTTVFATTGMKTIRSSTILKNPDVFTNTYNETGCVLFSEDLGCYLETASTGEGCAFFFENIVHERDFCLRDTPIQECEEVKAKYGSGIYSEHTLGNLTYTFYRLAPKN